MATSYSHESIERLKEQIDIVEVVANAISLKKTGANYKACCPFHGEKTPSFVVSPDKQIFKCFGCGVSGDAIEFVRKFYNLDFVEAIEKIAKDQGFTLERTKYDDSRDVYYRANKDAARYFVRSLLSKPNVAMDYLLEKRKLSHEMITKFGIGYADEKWSSLYNHMKALGYGDETLAELGLISIKGGKKYDRFRNRVMFPIISTSGKVIGFGGRALDDDGAKYINSPENPIFHKSNNLFALNFAREYLRKEDYLIVVEGYMDVIGLFQYGVGNVTATLGTALTENHGKILKRYAKKVILSYDADEAGRKAAYKGVDILRSAGVEVSVLHVDDGKDPDEYVKLHGKEGFLKLLSKSVSGTDYQLRHIARGIDLQTDEGKIRYIRDIAPVFEKLSPVEREVYAQKVGRGLKLDYNNILSQVGKERTDHRERPTRREENVASREMTATEKVLLKIIFMDSSYFVKLREHRFADSAIKTDLAKEILNLIQGEFSESDGFIDEKKIKDAMDPADGVKLDNIIKGVPVVDVEQTFRDCMRTSGLAELLEQEKRLLDVIAIADEEEQSQEGEKLQLKLMDVQKEIKKLRGGLGL